MKYSVALILLILHFFAIDINAQETKNKEEVKKDSLDLISFKVKYEDLQKDATIQNGLFNIYKLKDDFFFELNDQDFENDYLVVNKISQVSYEINGHGLNKGMAYESKMIRFEKDVDGNCVWVRTINPKTKVPKGDKIARSLKDNAISSVIEKFDIQSMNTDSTSVFIKVNKIFNGSETSFNDLLNNIGLGGGIKSNLSKIEKLKTFPKNIVAKSLLTTSVSEGGPSMPISMGVTTNIVLLPKEPMTPRFEDQRIGYFSKPMDYFSDKQQEVAHRSIITRWRLEPKAEDVEKYNKGELVEPKQQITYYIDPATPEQWVPYIQQGVRDWNIAFEEAGFKNAVTVKEVNPDIDTDFDIDDVRYSVIVYAASSKINAMGPTIVDPRSGEVLESDIIWWHNLMRGLKTWMRIQTGIIDKSARQNVYPDSLMGEAIRFVSSHEVGHTFGLKHNMGASYTYPVDSLRSATFTKRMGGTAPSIMDYARYNYVAQPGDNVTELNPKIGIYDKYAINWGYRWFGKKNPIDEEPMLNQIIKNNSDNPHCFYGRQQRGIIDPRSQSEDLGDDAIKASEYGIMNLKRIIPQIEDWTYEDGKILYKASRLYTDVIYQWQNYNGHVMANIGGFYINTTTYGDQQRAYEAVPTHIQKNALEYLINNSIRPQKWLFTPEHITKFLAVKDAPMGSIYYTPIGLIREKQASIFYDLLATDRLNRISENEVFQDGEVFTINYLLERLYDEVFAQTKKGESLDVYQRITQKNYVDALCISRNKLLEKLNKKKGIHQHHQCNIDNHAIGDIHFSMMPRISDVSAQKHSILAKIQKLLKKKKHKGDNNTKAHYEDLILIIEQHLKH